MFHVKHSEEIYIKAKDHLVSGEEFSLYFDPSRELLITTPKPSREDLPGYYESDEYISHTDSEKGLLNSLYHWVKKRSLHKKERLINSLINSKGSLLDIGAGTGSFLEFCQSRDWTVFGVEPSSSARDIAKEKSISLYSSLEELENRSFDVITMWHVLEHVPNLEETVASIQRLLKPNGVLLIAVPNFNSWDAKHYKSFWAAYDVPRHLWHFSQKSMSLIFTEPFELIKTLPMIFDSFYVSLLSEKYKTGKQNWVKAFYIGLRSNISAWTTKEYSSQIYCFRKTN